MFEKVSQPLKCYSNVLGSIVVLLFVVVSFGLVFFGELPFFGGGGRLSLASCLFP